MVSTILSLVLGLAVVAGQSGGPLAEKVASGGEPAVWLGVFLGDALDGGVEVVAVIPGGPASACGIRERDLLLSLDGKEISRRVDVGRVLLGMKPGREVVAEMLREGKPIRKTVRLQARTAPLISTMTRVLVARPGAGLALARELTVSAMPAELRQHYGAPADQGVLVTRLEEPGRIHEAGVRVGDVLLGVGERAVREPRDVRASLIEASPGATIELRVLREGERSVVRVKMPEAIEYRVSGGEPHLDIPGGGAAEAVRIRLLEERIRQLEEELRVLRRELDRLQ